MEQLHALLSGFQGGNKNVICDISWLTDKCIYCFMLVYFLLHVFVL